MTQQNSSPKRAWYQLELSDVGWIVFGLSLLLIMISGAWYSSGGSGSNSTQPVQIVTIDNVADVNQIVEDAECIVLLYAAWGFDPQLVKRSLEKAVVEWKAEQKQTGMTVYVVDHTNSRDLARWIDDFVELESELRVMGTGGWGTVLWVRDGEIVHYETSPSDWRPEDFEKQTEQVFPPREKSWWPF